MKKAIIVINILAVLFAAGTLYKISVSGYHKASLSPKKVQLYKEKINSFKSIDKLREFSIYGVNYQESLSGTLDKGLDLFNITTMVFLGFAFLNIVITINPKKKPNKKMKADGK